MLVTPGTTATAANTSLKEAIRAVSNFISVIPSRLICVTNIFLDSSSQGLREKKRKKKGKKKENIVVWRFYVFHKK